MIARFQSTEGAQTIKIPVTKDIHYGQFLGHLGRFGIAASSAKPFEHVKIIKRGTVVCEARAYPKVQIGYLGTLFGNFLDFDNLVDILEPDTLNGQSFFPLGFIEGWDYTYPESPRFILSLGEASGGGAVDQYARDRANDAYSLALSAQNQFPANAASLIDENNAPFDIAPGASHTFRWYNDSFPFDLDPADPSRVRFMQDGLYYLGLTGLRALQGNIADLRVDIDVQGTISNGEVFDGVVQGGQVVTYIYGSGDPNRYFTATVRNTSPDTAIRLDAIAKLTAFKMAN
ncbi:MAG: hypothetical protein CMQ40_10740 [Gammaproteobacteria bacterium]|nr:hypothetical protein [Gammaproteobacteria bacterium]